MNKIISKVMVNIFLMVLIFNFISTHTSVKAAEVATTTQIYVGSFNDNLSHDYTFRLQGLNSISSISTDNGNVSIKSVNGEYVTVTVSGGSPKDWVTLTKDMEVSIKVPDSIQKVTAYEKRSLMVNPIPFNPPPIDMHYPRNENWVIWGQDAVGSKTYQWNFYMYTEDPVIIESNKKFLEYTSQPGVYADAEGYSATYSSFKTINNPQFFHGYITSTGTVWDIPTPYGNPDPKDATLLGYAYVQYYTYDYSIHLHATGTKKVPANGYYYNLTVNYTTRINNPPTVRLNAPATAYTGNNISAFASANDPDGDPLTYQWVINPTTGFIDRTESGNTFKFTPLIVTDYELTVIVTDPYGQQAYDTKTIQVRAPEPVPILNKSGTYKENRKVTVDASSSWAGSLYYSIDWTKVKWEITPVTAGITSDNIKVAEPLTGSKTINMLFKKAGKYKVKCTLYNSLNMMGTAELDLDIVADLSPVADYTIPTTIMSDPNDGYYGTCTVTDKSYSPDNDIIAKRIYFYAFDSDNDGSTIYISKNVDGTTKTVKEYETWYVFDNGSWRAAGSYYDIKNLDIDTINDGNLREVKIRSSHVGRYSVRMIVREDFGQDTLTQFITVIDKKVDNTFTQ